MGPGRPGPRSTGLAAAQGEDWVLVEELGDEAEAAVARGRRGAGRSARTTGGGGRAKAAEPTGRRPAAETVDPEAAEAEVRAELARAAGPSRAPKLEQRLRDASRAFSAERFGDAGRILRSLAQDAPGAASVRELYGLSLYRQGRWRAAVRELEAFRLLTSSTEQHPVLADCYRALGQHQHVDELWLELRQVSPSAELVTEGRIVVAGSLIDRGQVGEAVAVLERGFTFPKRPREHHLRRAYALADAYERAGDVVRARELFAKVAAVDPDLADVRRRVRALS